MEQFKHDPNEFGGFQVHRLTSEEAKERLCARRWCPDRGKVQVQIPFETPRMFRILCARHFVMLMIVSAAAMGDPSPLGEGRRIAEILGVEGPIPNLSAPQVVAPENFCCAKCGKGLMPEPAGIYAGIRWIHNCFTEGEESS